MSETAILAVALYGFCAFFSFCFSMDRYGVTPYLFTHPDEMSDQQFTSLAAAVGYSIVWPIKFIHVVVTGSQRLVRGYWNQTRKLIKRTVQAKKYKKDLNNIEFSLVT